MRENNNNRFSPGLQIIHANHAEDLRKLVVQVLKNAPLRPLQNEVILVQSNGMGQWLKLALAEDDACGIAAGLDMQMPARFLWAAYRALLGREKVPETSPYDKPLLTWRLMRILPTCLEQAEFAPLRHFLRDDADLRKRHQLAEHLADLFDQYQVYRADWLNLWSQGKDQILTAQGQETPLAENQRWQASLWRAIEADIPEDQRHLSRARLHQQFLDACNQRTTPPTGLPPRLTVFGISSLPVQVIEAFDALARFMPVLLCVNNPCRYYWADIVEERQLLRFERYRHPDKPALAGLDTELMHMTANPLLAAWGRQGRDYIGLLYSYDQASTSNDQIDVFGDRADSANAPLLHRIQQGILDLAPPPEPRDAIRTNDHSVAFHAAHSRQREVEILHDQLLAAFEANSDLSPRDVIVMVPDIAAYAPHIEAVFGTLSFDDPRQIPYTIADRPERAASPLLQALEQLLWLPESRFAVSDLLDLLDVPAFRTRFGITAEDLPRLHQWVGESGIRWGLDSTQRAALDLPPGLEQNTWLFGLRRMLLGYAVGAGEAWHDIEPYPELGGLDAVAAGRLIDAIDRLKTGWDALNRERTPADWADTLRQLAEDCLTPESDQDQLQFNHFLDVIGQWQDACAEAELTDPLPLTVVRDALLQRFDEDNLSQRFLAGMVNFCTLMPMRAIPFRQVCLLGMNDGDYPRQRPPMDFDLMAEYYRPGDRSRREDDRYLFLEALLAARQRLYISYIGHDATDNSPRTPSVLVGQLQDHIAQGWYLEGDSDEDSEAGERLLEHLTQDHPLQPFSRRYFDPKEDPQRWFTYAREWRTIHEGAEQEENAELPPFPQETPLTLEQWQRFYRQPANLFFNERLGVNFNRTSTVQEDDEPFTVDALTGHQLKSDLIDAAIAAPDEAQAEVVEHELAGMRRAGLLPLGGAGERAASQLQAPVNQFLDNWAIVRARWPEVLTQPREIRLTLQGKNRQTSLTLEGWLDSLRHAPGDEDNAVLVTRRPSQIYSGKQVKYHYLTNLWLTHCLAAAQGYTLGSVLVTTDSARYLPPITEEEARAHLADLVDAYHTGLTRPLPMGFKTAMAWLDEEIDTAEDVPKGVRDAYEGTYNRSGEVQEQPALARSWPRIEDLWSEEFREWSERLYGPLRQVFENMEELEE